MDDEEEFELPEEALDEDNADWLHLAAPESMAEDRAIIKEAAKRLKEEKAKNG